MTLQELEKKVRILEDMEAIKKLKGQYARACDDSYNPEKLGELFTEDAIWDGGPIHGLKRGRDEIKKFFAETTKNIVFACHLLMAPDITVEGDKAHGTWYGQTLGTLRGNKGFWNSYIYMDEYKKVKGKWLISSTKVKHFFTSPYEGGWAKEMRMPMKPDQ